MKVLLFLYRFLEISLKVTGAGILGTYIIGWKQPFPMSWVWVILSSIGGFIEYISGVGISKIIVISFTWPFILWFALGTFLGLGLAGYEFMSSSKQDKT